MLADSVERENRKEEVGTHVRKGVTNEAKYLYMEVGSGGRMVA